MKPLKTKRLSRNEVQAYLAEKMGKNHPGLDLFNEDALALLIKENEDDDVRGALLHFWKQSK